MSLHCRAALVLGLACLPTLAHGNCSVAAGLLESAPDSRFLRSEPVAAEPIVEDLETGLIWQGCESGRSGSQCELGSALALDWSGALQHAAGSGYAGFSDWRLPNARELASLVETGCVAPALNTTIFPVDIGAAVWTSTAAAQPVSTLHVNAWQVDFANGERLVVAKSSLKRIRLVRAGRGLAAFDAGADFTPDPLSLPVQSGRPQSQLVEFGPLTVSGIDTRVGIAVLGEGTPQYSVNGGAFVQLPGAVQAGDQVRVRHTSAAIAAGDVESTLRIGPLLVVARSVTASDNADLAALALDAGNLAPTFAPATLAYTASVANAVTAVRVTATLDDAAASLQIAGVSATSAVASDPLPLEPGSNLIPIEVLAEDGLSARAYSITVQRELASSTVTLQSDADSVLPGDPVTLTALVTGDVPTGSVDFLANGQGIPGCAARAVSTGMLRAATCTTSSLPTGQVLVRAEYSGDARNLASSGELLQIVNTPPVLTVVSSATLDEDTVVALDFQVGDAESPATALTVSLTASPGSLFDASALSAGLSGTGTHRTLSLAGRENAFGSGSVTLVLLDPQGGRSEQVVAVEVHPVNDAPFASMPAFRAHPSGTSGALSVPGFVSPFGVGPANEAGQQLTFEVNELSDPDQVLDSIAIDPTGQLDYVLSGRSGVARVRVVPLDDGGTLRGGIDQGQASVVRLFVGPGSDVETRIDRILPLGADLPAAIAGGARAGEYRVQVLNHGPVAVEALQVQAVVARGLASLLWECVTPVGCAPAAGSGALSVAADLGVDQLLEAKLSGVFMPDDRFLVLEAEASAAPGALLGRTDDRQVLVEAMHPSAIFQNGFE